MKATYPFLTVVSILFFLIFPTNYSHAENIKCNNIVRAVRPCVVFFRGGSGVTGMPPAMCCAGVSTFSQMAKNTTNRATVCRCVQLAIKNVRITDATVKALPRRCGITLPFSFSPYVKCPG
ncbi:non-specific lipid-transfer protein 2B-like [Lycium barbarum]|uniref:non-specific lipid-transfer protein 2B-like n=1 Tax=Lycium barbarum TaxID=112863 RepID=UPI00293ED992|nr:non-specific lipid-transfer protein 2B-like [Lycium barbarum]